MQRSSPPCRLEQLGWSHWLLRRLLRKLVHRAHLERPAFREFRVFRARRVRRASQACQVFRARRARRVLKAGAVKRVTQGLRDPKDRLHQRDQRQRLSRKPHLYSP